MRLSFLSPEDSGTPRQHLHAALSADLDSWVMVLEALLSSFCKQLEGVIV